MSTATADPHRQAIDQYFAYVVLPVAMATRNAGAMVGWMRGESRKWKRKARKNADSQARAIADYLKGFATEIEDADALQKIKAYFAATDAGDVANASFAAY
jgi:hypothetical protein